MRHFFYILYTSIFCFAIFPFLQLQAKFIKPKYFHGTEVTQKDSDADAFSLNKQKSFIRSVEFVKPKPILTASGLERINPEITKILPDLADMLTSAQLSKYFDQLYQNKIASIKRGENFTYNMYFDCATLLQMQHRSGQRILLAQADMDVVTDGSDPERFENLSDYDEARISNWFLPQTSYSWGLPYGKKNPFLNYYPKAVERLEFYKKEFAREAETDAGVIWREMQKACDDQIYRMKARGLGKSVRNGLQSRRYMLSVLDPFIVLPKNMVNLKGTWSPKIGDFAVVIYKNKIIPALMAESGPVDKIGEASLKIAKLINSKSSGQVSALKTPEITYLIFPKSADYPPSEPNPEAIAKRCWQLLEKIGGLGTGYNFLQNE